MEDAGLATAAYWAPLLETIADIAFAVVIIALAVELVSGRLAKRFERKIDAARELQIAELKNETTTAQLELARLTTNRDVLLKRDDGREALIAKLMPFKGTIYDAGLSMSSGEQADFLWNLITEVLDKAGWKQVEWKGPGLGGTFGNVGMPGLGAVAAQNVEVHVHPQSREKFQPAIDALVTSLNAIGIKATDARLNVANDNPEAIHILVGEIR